MRSFEFIKEARKNPELNPKQSINAALDSALAQTTDTVAGTKNLFVSFTRLEKLGVNPRSDFNTPLGIYAYPADYVSSTIDNSHPSEMLPFAGDMPYANLFSASGNILDIDLLTEEEYAEYLEKLKQLYGKLAGVASENAAEYIDRLNTASDEDALVLTPGGQFWYVTMKVASKLPGSAAVNWNSIFRKLGIDGVVDLGDGIIHGNEPTQAVFFSKNAVTNVVRVENKHSPEDVRAKKAVGSSKVKLLQQLKTVDTSQIIDIMGNSANLKYIDYVKDPIARMELINLYPNYTFRYMSRPSKEETYAAVKANPQNIEYSKIPVPNSVFLDGLKQNAATVGFWLEYAFSYDKKYREYLKDPAISDFIFSKVPAVILKLPEGLVTYDWYSKAVSSPLLPSKQKQQLKSMFPQFAAIENRVSNTAVNN